MIHFPNELSHEASKNGIIGIAVVDPFGYYRDYAAPDRYYKPGPLNLNYGDEGPQPDGFIASMKKLFCRTRADRYSYLTGSRYLGANSEYPVVPLRKCDFKNINIRVTQFHDNQILVTFEKERDFSKFMKLHDDVNFDMFTKFRDLKPEQKLEYARLYMKSHKLAEKTIESEPVDDRDLRRLSRMGYAFTRLPSSIVESLEEVTKDEDKHQIIIDYLNENGFMLKHDTNDDGSPSTMPFEPLLRVADLSKSQRIELAQNFLTEVNKVISAGKTLKYFNMTQCLRQGTKVYMLNLADNVTSNGAMEDPLPQAILSRCAASHGYIDYEQAQYWFIFSILGEFLGFDVVWHQEDDTVSFSVESRVVWNDASSLKSVLRFLLNYEQSADGQRVRKTFTQLCAQVMDAASQLP